MVYICKKGGYFMEEQFNESQRPVNPRRKTRSQMQVFKETYLPTAIIAVAAILTIVFIAGSAVRGSQKKAFEKDAIAASNAAVEAEKELLEQEASDLISKADILIKQYDYQGAIDLLNTFSGDISQYIQINDKILESEQAQKATVAWSDPSKVPNLSFQLLVADPARAFKYAGWSNSINKNFVTTDEFSKILQQLYDNGYVLVDIDDIFTTETNASGKTVYKANTLQLPNGKKPIMLTQTNVNYNYYLIDSDNDHKADAKGGGFASKLLWDGTNFTCEMVDATGKTVTGDYDLVPILEKFIASHPDFSYHGARANLALTGHNGLLGYRTHPAYEEHPQASEIFGKAQYEKDKQDATAVIKALRDRGYTVSCYTYSNISYNDAGLDLIKSNLQSWKSSVTPILGDTQVLTYAQGGDIAGKGSYSGEKFDTLQNFGFRYYLGFCTDGKPWAVVENNYVRQGRILVSGSTMAYNSDWFKGMFDAASVLNTTRGTVPN